MCTSIATFLSAGRGVVIHRENCVNVEDYRKHPEKWLPVTWQAASDRLFASEIRVYVVNRTGMLAAVAAAIANLETNIDRVAIEEHGSDAVILTFELRVRDRKHLARISASYGVCPMWCALPARWLRTRAMSVTSRKKRTKPMNRTMVTSSVGEKPDRYP